MLTMIIPKFPVSQEDAPVIERHSVTVNGKRSQPQKVMRESQIEHRLVQRVKELGGEVRKVKWVGRAGAPDRLVMLPERLLFNTVSIAGSLSSTVPKPPRSIWVELKAPGVKVSAHQMREHERMRKMGQRVEVVDSYERIEEILK